AWLSRVNESALLRSRMGRGNTVRVRGEYIFLPSASADILSAWRRRCYEDFLSAIRDRLFPRLPLFVGVLGRCAWRSARSFPAALSARIYRGAGEFQRVEVCGDSIFRGRRRHSLGIGRHGKLRI